MTKEEILEIMKTEKDLYELNINWFDCIIYRFKWHLNWYVSLLKEWYDDLDTNELEVHWWITYEWNLKDLMIQWLTKDYWDNKFIWFDTAHAWDAFLYPWFEYMLLSWTYRDYNYVYNELKELTNQLTNQLNNKLKLTEWQRHLEWFIKEIKDYSELSTMQFYMKYCFSWNEDEVMQKQYKDYLLLEQAEDTDVDDILSYEEWLDEVYYEENQDDIQQSVDEYKEPLEVKSYKSDNDYSIHEITLTCGWPNIYVTINTRWDRYTYEFHWGSEHIEENLSYLSDEIDNYFINLIDNIY